jgi:hypothetical protein
MASDRFWEIHIVQILTKCIVKHCNVTKNEKNPFSLLQKGDGLGVFNFVTKHHWKASNFVTPLQIDTTSVKIYFFETFLLFKILDEFFMGIAVL